MMKKEIKHCLVLIIMFFSFVNIVHASLDITEVMYNPDGTDTNREWIKLYNNSNSTITIVSGRSDSAWRFSDDVEGLELHLINNQLEISPNSYAILANNRDVFMEEYPDFNGPVADTSMSLSNVSGKVRIWDGSNPRKIIAFKEYPFTNNPSSNQDDSASNTENLNSIESDNTAPEESNNVSKLYKISTKIIAPKIVTAGVPFLLDHNTTGLKKEKIILGKFVWNFGDGMNKGFSVLEPFNYIYDYPGEYVLSLSYFDSVLDAKPDSVDRLTIKVVPSGVVISSVGNYSDPFVELENKSSYEMSISGWILKGSVHAFVIPENTVILANKKLKISPKITGFDYSDLSSISIVDKNGQIFATHPNYTKSNIKYSANKNGVENIVKSDMVESIHSEDMGGNEDVINLNNIGASAGGIESSLGNKTLFYLGLVCIILLGMISIILIRRNTEIPDYLDKEINPKDMTILE